MFWLLLLFVVGLSYIFYRYKAVVNKKIFFTSPLFVSIAGSLALLMLAIGLVNVADVQPKDSSNDNATSTRVEDIDTSANQILLKGPEYSYRMILKLSEETQITHLMALQNTYKRFSQSEDESISSLGNFGLGVIALEEIKIELAREHFLSVANKNLPFLHYCLAEVRFQEDKKEDATSEYEKELQLPDGNRVEAFVSLVDLYEKDHHYDKLHALLLTSDLAEMHFPEQLARTTLLMVKDYLNYWVWVFKMFTHRIHAIGFIAAFLISAMWLLYLFYLDIFKLERFIWLIGVFAGGMFFCPGVFLIVDSIELTSTWSLDGNFLNDLAYCIFMIGVPEELVKMIPLLILVVFSQNVKEPVDYLIYGSASALGFAFMENLLYFAEIKNGIIHGRAYLSVIGHMTNTSIVAYAFVVSLYKRKDKSSLWYNLPRAFLLAATVHGIYDVLLFHELIFFFFVFFVLVVQYWIMMINNAMNNSAHFDYRTASRAEGSRLFITLALTGVFALEYVYAGFSAGTDEGNIQILSNAGFAGFMIIFFSSNLASFDLIKGYWRSMSMFSKEKRGYGNRQQVSPWFSWYFVNASRAHNYVGVQVKICNERYNRILAEYLDDEHEGRIVGRIILYEDDTPDPHWFLVRMKTPVPLPNDLQDYILVRLRYQEDSLLFEDYVEVFFKGIPEMNLLRQERPRKEDFPFYGWAVMKFDSAKKENVPTGIKIELARRITETRDAGEDHITK